MAAEIDISSVASATRRFTLSRLQEELARRLEPLAITFLAILAGMGLFSLFLLALGKSPLQFVQLVYAGGFGTWFSLQNAFSRAAPLLLTALCVALPARLGLTVIGGEGALALGVLEPPQSPCPCCLFRTAGRCGLQWVLPVPWLAVCGSPLPVP